MSLMPTGRPRSGVSVRPRRGAPARAVEIERREGADLGLARGDRLGAEVDHVRGRELAGLDGAGKVERGEHQAAPPIRLTTRSVKRRAIGMTR